MRSRKSIDSTVRGLELVIARLRLRLTRFARSTRPAAADSSVRIPQPFQVDGDFDPARDIALLDDDGRPIVWIRTAGWSDDPPLIDPVDNGRNER